MSASFDSLSQKIHSEIQNLAGNRGETSLHKLTHQLVNWLLPVYRRLVSRWGALRDRRRALKRVTPSALQVLSSENLDMQSPFLTKFLDEIFGPHESLEAEELTKAFSNWAEGRGEFQETHELLSSALPEILTKLPDKSVNSLSLILGSYGFFSLFGELQRKLAVKAASTRGPANIHTTLNAAVLLGDLELLRESLHRFRHHLNTGRTTYESYLALSEGRRTIKSQYGEPFFAGQEWCLVGPKSSPSNKKEILRTLDFDGYIQTGAVGNIPKPIHSSSGAQNVLYLNSSAVSWLRAQDNSTQNSLISGFDSLMSSQKGRSLFDPKHLSFSPRHASRFFHTGSPQMAQFAIMDVLFAGASISLTGVDFYASPNPYSQEYLSSTGSSILSPSGGFAGRQFGRCRSLAKHNALANWQLVKNIKPSLSFLDDAADRALKGEWISYTAKLEQNFGQRRL